MKATIKAPGLYVAGLGFLALAWAKNRLEGYATPSSIAPGDLGGALDHLHRTTSTWMRYLEGVAELRGRDVLELGPGANLGAGAVLLAHGANSYHAVDAFELADVDDRAFLATVLDHLDAGDFGAADVERARRIVADRHSPEFTYAVDRGFDVSELAGGRSFDLIVSGAAFEHFADIETTIAQMSAVARSGCVCVHIVDFQTHSRWIREHDPNNIYRYSDPVYRLFAFPGQPNRKRPGDYVAALQRNGWINVRVVADRSVDPRLADLSTTGLVARYTAPGAAMSVLTGIVLGERR